MLNCIRLCVSSCQKLIKNVTYSKEVIFGSYIDSVVAPISSVQPSLLIDR